LRSPLSAVSWYEHATMTLTLVPHSDEVVIAEVPIPPVSLWRWRDSSFRFGFVVTAEAAYVPVGRQGFSLIESLESRRVPLSEIRSVSLVPAGSLSLLLAADLALVLFCLWMALPGLLAQGFTWTAFSVPIFIVPTVRRILGARGRWRLQILLGTESLYFTPSDFDVPSSRAKRLALASQAAFVAGCRTAGVIVHDKSPALTSQPA
jgi:hypothetical protein